MPQVRVRSSDANLGWLRSRETRRTRGLGEFQECRFLLPSAALGVGMTKMNVPPLKPTAGLWVARPFALLFR